MIINGLIFGIISTLHCAGMCGPLAVYIPGNVKTNRLAFAINYQIGRIAIYVMLGLLVYSIGFSFSLFRAQQVLSIIMGCLLVLYVLVPFLKIPGFSFLKYPYKKLMESYNRLLLSGRKGSALVMGAINGLLPCGAIYMAAMYCAVFSNAGEAVAYMTLFGIGTMPVFVTAWFLVSKQLFLKINRLYIVYRVLPLLIGLLMILRGADLGIPYLSPGLSQNVVKDCCRH